ncbi:helix-turn-helix transcriptional regulator [Dongia soli]|uniref:helix-turn-helix transcriptional regulator n=1 Tax=Dongia soli TaxID=600628 RepID=UPI0036120460
MPQAANARIIHKKSFDAGVPEAVLRERREALGMSQSAHADLAHVSQRTIVNIEFGKGSVTLESLKQ